MDGGNQVIEFRDAATANSYYQSSCREKIRRMLSGPYRKPTQVGGCKCTKARERDLSKELGTLAP